VPAAQSLHKGHYAHICNSECAAGSPTIAATAAREHLGTELALLAGRGAHKTQKTRSRALSAGHYHHMVLCAHICTSKCAAGSPTTAAAAAGEHFGSELALFAGCGAHKTQKNTQQGTVCGTTSSHGPLCSYLHFAMCRWEPYDSSSSSTRTLWTRVATWARCSRPNTAQTDKVRASEPHLVSARACPRAC